MLDFTGQVSVVTGAGGNLGRAIATVLSGLGSSLVLADVRPEPLESLASELGGSPVLVAGADVRTREGCSRIVDAALAQFNRIDALANTVGTFRTRSVAEGAADDWSALMDINALTALRLSEAVLPAMLRQKYGRIVHVAAGAGQKSFASASVYAASKAAVMRITEAVSEEHKLQGITANCVMPGTMDTPENRRAMPDADPGVWVQPEQVASVVAFLLSRAAAAVTAASVPAPGRQ